MGRDREHTTVEMVAGGVVFCATDCYIPVCRAMRVRVALHQSRNTRFGEGRRAHVSDHSLLLHRKLVIGGGETCARLRLRWGASKFPARKVLHSN